MTRTLIALIFLAVFCVGVVWLQIFLSKRENKWLGLILPLLVFCFSLMALMSVAGIAVYIQNIQTSATQIEPITVLESGGGAREGAVSQAYIGPLIGMAVLVFLVYNIPTVVLLAVYFACREKRKRNALLGKMSAQDLE